MYDYILKFNHKKISHYPRIIKIVLRFDLKKNNTFSLISSILALELISGKKSLIFFKKNYKNINLKIKSGNPTSCVVTLRKDLMLNLLVNLFFTNIPKSFISNKITITNIRQNNICFFLTDLSVFNAIEDNYYLFKNLGNLSISLITDSNDYPSFLYLTSSIKIPVTHKICVSSSIGRV